jgi:hypothetical protein
MPGDLISDEALFEGGLLVSLPGTWIARLRLPGSLFGQDALRDMIMPLELRLALALVVWEATARGVPVQFVARPEIFTHGRARAWLDERIGDIQDHVAITDGHSLKNIPGLRNHMFFYPRGVPAQEKALRYLLHVAPELFLGLTSQINGGLAFRLGTGWCRPPSLHLRLPHTPVVGTVERFPFCCGLPGHSAARTVEPIPATEPLPADRPSRFVPLSETALADEAFLRLVCQLALEALFGGAEQLLLELPRLADGGDARERLAATIRAFAATGIVFPRALSPAVQFVTAPPRELRASSVLLHPGVAFWRYGLDFFEAAGRVEVAGGGASRFSRLLSDWLGRPVGLIRPASMAGIPRVTLNDLP